MIVDKVLKIERFHIMKKSTVRIFAIILAALMVLSLLPLAYAHAEEIEIPEGTEISGFIWVNGRLQEDGHKYGEVVNEDFLVNPEEPGDCVTGAVYWKSCINVNPYTGERCGVTAEEDWNQAMERLKTELSQRRANGEQADFEQIFVNAITELDAKYKFSVEPKGHTWVEVDYQPADCEQPGWETYHYCADCGEKSGYLELAPSGHRYVDGVCEICGAEDPDLVTPVEIEASSEDAEPADDVNNVEENKEENPDVNEEKDEVEAVVPVEGEEDKQESVEQAADETRDEAELPTREEIRENMQMTVGETDPAIVDNFKESMDDLGLDAETTTILNVMDVTPLHKDDNTKLSEEELEIVGGIDFVMPIPEDYDPDGAPLEVYHFNEKTGEWELMEIEVNLEQGVIIVKNAKSFSPFAMIRKGAADPFALNRKRLDTFITAQGNSAAVNSAEPTAAPSTDGELFISDTETFDAAPCTVTLDPDGGTLTGETSRQTDENGKLTLPTAEECTKDGYALVAWTKEDESYDPGEEVTFTDNTTLTAQWDKKYTVTFDGSGGTRKEGEADVSTAEQIILESAFTEAGDEGVALKSNPFTYTDYMFTGWCTDDSNVPTIKDKGTVKKDAFTSQKLALYACWAETATVTFDPNYDTSTAHKTQDVPKNVETALDKDVYKRSYYLFDGWYENKECTGTALESITTSEDVTLYAKWIGPVYITGSISGTGTAAYVGETLTAKINNAVGITDLSYQWYWYGKTTAGTGWHAISGETNETYAPKSEYNGKRIACRVTKGDAWALSNYKLVAKGLTSVKWKQDLVDIIDRKAITEYARVGQIEGVTKNMEYSTDGGETWTAVTTAIEKGTIQLSDEGVMSVLEPGKYLFRIIGTEVKSDSIVVERWFTLRYSSTSETDSSTGSGSTSSTSYGTAWMELDGTKMTSATSTTNVKYTGKSNMWVVREGTKDTITLTIRPSSRSYGHWNLNNGSYHNVGEETIVTVTPMEGPEHYKIIFNRSNSSPRTADESRLGLWAALCVTSLTGAAMILTRTRKRRKNEQ